MIKNIMKSKGTGTITALGSLLLLAAAANGAYAQDGMDASSEATSTAESEETMEPATDAPFFAEPSEPELTAEDAAPEASAAAIDAANDSAAADAAEPSGAETVPTIAVEPARAEADADAVIEASGPKATKLDSIVVTAERRVERLQDVPVAITVVNQKQMEAANVTQITDLSRLAPSLEVNGQPGNADTRISIRGISTESFSVTAEQAVSLVVDGVVLGKAPSVSLFDVGRVEILRGPQGTLFGKNASAGVVSISTNAPDPSRFMAGIRTDLGSEWDYRLVQASVNMPIGDTAALRINGGQTYTSGFYYNAVREEDSEQNIKGARARFLWDITPSLTLNLIADYEEQYTSEQIYLAYERYNDPETGEPQEIARCNGTFAGEDNNIVCNNDPTFNEGKSWGYSGQLEWLVNDYTINSITAMRRYTQYNEIDVDGMNGNYYNNANAFNNRVFTQEVRIASPADERLKYVAGVFYSDSHVPNDLDQLIGPDMLAALGTGTVPISLCTLLGVCLGDVIGLYQPNQYTADIKSAAVFAQFTLQITDPLKLIAGARYTRDDVQMVSSSYIGVATSLLPDPIIIPQAQDLLGREKIDAVSWRAGLQFDFTDDLMAYFTASRGYKGPQIVFVPPNLIPSVNALALDVNLPTPAAINVVRPEYPMDYQLGVKATLFGGLFAANAAIFHTTIKDFQASVFNGQASFTPTNIPELVTKGFEFDLLGFLSENLMFNAGFLYNSATYPGGYRGACTQVSDVCPDTDAETTQDIGGRQLVVAPKWKVTFSPDYSFDMPFGTRGFVNADVVYRSEMHFSASPDTRTDVDARTIIGARIGIRGGGDDWELSVFGRNLTEERNPAFLFAPYLLGSASSPGVDTSGHALYTESFRFFGVSLGMRF
ncbi:MAG: TonB-dependent receptor [Pseudomonadota bacterium]|nr:TonB-dependent receptor [Pseudomonadota bacterium]